MRKISKKEFNEILLKKVNNRIIDTKNLDVEDNMDVRLYEGFGLDSLDVMEIILEIEDLYGIKVDNRLICGIYTPRDLWGVIEKSME